MLEDAEVDAAIADVLVDPKSPDDDADDTSSRDKHLSNTFHYNLLGLYDLTGSRRSPSTMQQQVMQLQ